MANTTKEKVLLIAPELVTASDELIALILEDVAQSVSAAIFGTKQERAQRYLAAHLLTLSGAISSNAGKAGPVTAEKVGDVSTSYWMLNLKDTNRYDETVYGRQYMAIRKSCIVKFRTILPC